jgi:hypothetical protein
MTKENKDLEISQEISDYLGSQEEWIQDMVPDILNEYLGFETRKGLDEKDKVKKIETKILRIARTEDGHDF